jgi:hypothetical protein
MMYDAAIADIYVALLKGFIEIPLMVENWVGN